MAILEGREDAKFFRLLKTWVHVFRRHLLSFVFTDLNGSEGEWEVLYIGLQEPEKAFCPSLGAPLGRPLLCVLLYYEPFQKWFGNHILTSKCQLMNQSNQSFNVID